MDRQKTKKIKRDARDKWVYDYSHYHELETDMKTTI